LRSQPGSRNLPVADLAVMLLGSVIISLNPVWVKLAQVGPTAAAFWRMALGGLALAAFSLGGGAGLAVCPRVLGASLICAVLFALDLVCWHASILAIGPGLSTVLGNFQVFFLVLYGLVFLREAVGVRRLIAVPMAVSGLFLLVGPGWGRLSDDWRLGVIFGLATALFYAAYLLLLRRLQQGQPWPGLVRNMAWISLIAAVFLALGVPLAGESFHVPWGRDWAFLGLLGIAGQGLGWVLISYSLARLPVSVGGLVILLQPTLAFVWDVAFFGRPTTGLDVAGAGLALTAIYLGAVGRKGAE